MRSSAVLFVALAAVASAQSSSGSASSAASVSTSISTPPYSNPNTAYLTETNSLGVVTGMPSVVTSQPAGATAVTSQPLAASVYAGLTTGLNTIPLGNTTATVFFSGSVTSVVRSSPTPSASGGSGSGSGSGSSGSAGSGGASGTTSAKASSSSAAAAHIMAASGALGFAGAFFAIFL
jgi:hypothetical protein